MAIALNDNTLSTIPFFSENQVLRARDLNNLVNAVFDQLRQNRVFTIGIGIIEGFTVRWDEELGALVISRGFGVSSDGYAFDLAECAFTHFRGAGDLNVGYKLPASNCEQYGELLDRIAGSGFELAAPALDDPRRQEWQPLVPGEGGGDTIPPGNYCLLYLYREAEVFRASCFSDCEARGADQVGSYHAILLPVEQEEQPGPDDNSFEVQLPPVPRLPAFGLVEQEVKLCRILDWGDLYTSYRAACLAVSEELALAFGAASVLLDTTDEGSQPEGTELYEGTRKVLDEFINELYPAEPGQECTDIQYLYGYCRELILCYAALYHLLQGRTINLGNGADSENVVIRCAFSAHIGLRGVYFSGEDGGRATISTTSEDIDPCRSGRILPDSGEERLSLLVEARQLLARMKALVRRDTLLLSTWRRDGLTEIRLTPDARRWPFLRGRALPFYYQASTMDVWRVGEQPNPAAYRYLPLEDHPLLYAEEDWDFYRIAGHLGRPLEQLEVRNANGGLRDVGVTATLEELRDCLNLAFDIVEVSLDEIGDEEIAPPIQHTRWANWYKNTRNDLLSALLPIVPTGDDTGGSGSEAVKFVLTFLQEIESLSDLDDWDELPPTDFCAPVPDSLSSALLDKFVTAYEVLLDALAEARLKDDDQLLPFLDRRLAICIRQAAIDERLYRETVWRQTYFAGFARAHPGLLHLGGVPKGGTFVLVYKSTLNRTGLLDYLLKFSDNIFGNLNGLSDERLIELAQKFGVAVSFFERREVVADFCLPYLCCGTGPVHLQVVPPSPPPPLSLSVEPESCSRLERLQAGVDVAVRVNEAGGMLSVATTAGDTIGDPIAITTANLPQTVTLGEITEVMFPGSTLELLATYGKGDRKVEAPFTLTRMPEFGEVSITFRETVTEEGVAICLYDMIVDITPTDATLTLEGAPEGAGYDAESLTLRVPEDFVNEGVDLRLRALSGRCINRTNLDLPAKPLDDDVIVTDPTPDTPAPAPDFSATLNARREARRNAITTLEAGEGDLDNDEAIRRSFLYVGDTGENANPGKGLQPALDALVRLRSDEPEREDLVRNVATVLATGFLDKLALVGRNDELTETRAALLNTLREGLDELGVSRDTVLSDWKSSDLQEGISEARLSNIDKQLRE